MPIIKSKYPKNWKEISLNTKRRYGFICAYCLTPRTRHNPLTVHHIDNDPMHNDELNLVPMHGSCHLLFHSRFSRCRFPATFWEICHNNWSQLKFDFMYELSKTDNISKFIRYKIATRYRRQKCSKSSSVESGLPLL